MQRFVLLLGGGFVVLWLTGCASTRSISDSGYRGGDRPRWGYKGELSEFDIVGEASRTNISNADIQSALNSGGGVRLQRGEPVLVIQSGAMAPDVDFLREFERYFPNAPFSGQPAQEKEGYSARLRLAAAQGGYKHLVCYWGALESAQEDHATKSLSWVPIAGSFVPDESQNLRIRLKAIVLDVATGRWKMVMPLPIEDKRLSAKFNREASDQKQVAQLKNTGYRALVGSILENTGFP